jgi:hypothetical protein
MAAADVMRAIVQTRQALKKYQHRYEKEKGKYEQILKGVLPQSEISACKERLDLLALTIKRHEEEYLPKLYAKLEFSGGAHRFLTALRQVVQPFSCCWFCEHRPGDSASISSTPHNRESAGLVKSGTTYTLGYIQSPQKFWGGVLYRRGREHSGGL